MDWNKMLDWQLLTDSHKFPGPEGGTCINEAALVYAGFKYHRVSDIGRLPACFSRPIAKYAMELNDLLEHNDRQLLIPFVSRLAGSRDTPAVEAKRVAYIVRRVATDILPLPVGFPPRRPPRTMADIKKLCRDVRAYVCRQIGNRVNVDLVYFRNAENNMLSNMERAAQWVEYDDSSFDAIECIAPIIRASVYHLGQEMREATLSSAFKILDGALKIGKQAEPVDVADGIARMQAMKAKAGEAHDPVLASRPAECEHAVPAA